MRAAIYARYSSHEQDGGESIDFQLERCQEHIRQNGWELDDSNIFIDRARSGTSTHQRKEFNRMLSASKAKNRTFDVVVVWSTSRFGRNQEQATLNKIFLRREGIEVKFVSQPLPDGPEGTLMEHIYEFMDERLAEQIGENAFEGQRQVVLQGFHGGGKAPYGYILQSIEDPNGKVDRAGHPVKHVQFVVDPEHAPIVVRIYVEYASRRGYKKIAEGLNQDGIISPGGTTWATSAVRTILHNEAYLGWRVWNKTRRNKKLLRGTVVRKPRKDWIIFKEAHLPIITEKHWDAVRERLGEIHVHVTNGRGNRATGASPRIFTGILRCETCGANFVASGRKRKGALTRYYKCSFRANRGATVCSNSRMVREDNLLEAVTDILTKKILIPEMVDQVLEEIQQKSEEEFGGVEGLMVGQQDGVRLPEIIP